jgi:gamma-glutamylcyclotransferase (GGCT)/AIG2-like uncharacterized protein YtfP
MGKEGELVFVYGALRRGAAHAWRMAAGKFVGAGRVRGRLYAIDWYPGVVVDEEGGTVVGEVHRVDAQLRAELDEFEGIGHGGDAGDEYARVRVPVRMEGGATVEAWIYDYRHPVDGRVEVESGDWIASGLGGAGER